MIDRSAFLERFFSSSHPRYPGFNSLSRRHCLIRFHSEKTANGLGDLSPLLFDNNAYFAGDPVFFKTLFAITVQGL
jgi:hypothetical protein